MSKEEQTFWTVIVFFITLFLVVIVLDKYANAQEINLPPEDQNYLITPKEEPLDLILGVRSSETSTSLTDVQKVQIQNLDQNKKLDMLLLAIRQLENDVKTYCR